VSDGVSRLSSEASADHTRGNLSQRSLLEVVNKEDLVQDSEFMETLVVAVPKSVDSKAGLNMS
jgi:hypothetical protein